MSPLSNEAGLRIGLAIAQSNRAGLQELEVGREFERLAAGSLGDRKDDTQVALCRRVREVESRAAHAVPEAKGDKVSPFSNEAVVRDQPVDRTR